MPMKSFSIASLNHGSLASVDEETRIVLGFRVPLFHVSGCASLGSKAQASIAMADLRVFSLKQVSAHKSKEDCWFVIGGKVYNVTKFLQEHPGGEEVLVEASGRDATRDFEDVGHSPAAKGMLDNYLVGVLEGFKGVVSVNKQSTTSSGKQDKPAFKDMPAFVIKEEKPSAFIRLIEFLVPLVIVGATFLFKSAMKEPVLSS